MDPIAFDDMAIPEASHRVRVARRIVHRDPRDIVVFDEPVASHQIDAELRADDPVINHATHLWNATVR